MKRILMALMLVAGCGAGGDQANQASGNDAPIQAAGLTGLYEGGASTRPNQLCVIDRGEGRASFGLVVWGGNMHSCSGAGTITSQGENVTLTMTGDESCAIEARMAGGRLILPDTLPQGCAYYCGAQAKMSGASFARRGGSVEDALKAKDLVGEPLCADGGAAPAP